MHPRLRKIVFKDEIELKIGISQSGFTNRVAMTSYPVIKVKNLKKSPIWGLITIRFKFENYWRSFEVTQTLLYSNFHRLSHANLIRLPIPVCRFLFWYLFGKIFESKMSFEDDPINWFVQKSHTKTFVLFNSPVRKLKIFFRGKIFKISERLKKISNYAWRMTNLSSQKQSFF